MNAVTSVFRRFFPVLALTFISLESPCTLWADDLPDCSVSKTNSNCKIIIDRQNPVAPPTIQMYSDQKLTVVIRNPFPFERYFLDFATGQATVTPDEASAIITGVSGDLAKLTQIILPSEKNNHFIEWKAKKTPTCDSLNLSDSQLPARGQVSAAEGNFKECFRRLADLALPLYKELEPLVAPDSLTSVSVQQEPDYYLSHRKTVVTKIDAYINLEAAVSTKITALSKVAFGSQPPPCTANPPAGAPACTPPPLTYSMEDESTIIELSDYQKLIDAVSSDLAGYDQRIKDLGLCGFEDVEGVIGSGSYCWRDDQRYSIGTRVVDEAGNIYMLKADQNQCHAASSGEELKCVGPARDPQNWVQVPQFTFKSMGAYSKDGHYQAGDEVTFSGATWICINNCLQKPSNPSWLKSSQTPPTPRFITIVSRADDHTIYQNMVTRTVTYSLDTLNLVSYSQQTAPSPSNKKALASIAINFADRPNSFAVAKPYTALRWEASAGVFLSWLPNRAFTLSSTGAVVDSKTRPTAVPFGAANYRLTADFGSRWKQNFYATGAIGINTNNSTAEFGVGPSYSWRLLMISALAHIGHDTSWISMTPGSNGDLPTSSHWTVKAALGISVRIPSLTGR